jgi:transposase-like protein
MSGQFRDLVATELYCPKCRRAQPVREKLLLVLPRGEIHEYLCAACASSLGKRTVSQASLMTAAAAARARRPARRIVNSPMHPGYPPRLLLK